MFLSEIHLAVTQAKKVLICAFYSRDFDNKCY